MTVMSPGKPVSRTSYIVRAVLAITLIVAFAVWMVARGTGALENTPKVHAEMPVEAGLLTTGAPVRYHGVKVGEISSIDAGTTSSQVSLAINDTDLSSIPATVVMRVLPRTFFGDIYVQLVDEPVTNMKPATSLSDGDEIRIDSGPEAINLYDIFTKISSVLAEVQPEKMNIALAAVSQAIGDKGGDLGIMIDDWWQASHELESAINRFVDATPRFRAVIESLRRATGAITSTLRSTTSISKGILQHQQSLGQLLTAASGFAGVAAPFMARQRANIITVVGSTSRIMSTVADNPHGVTDTVTEAAKFGAAGTILFASGRFNITAVPTFSQPMPYTAADCPVYGNLRGSQCFGTGSPIGTGPVRQSGAPNPPVLSPRQLRPTQSGHPQPGYTPSGFTGPAVIDGTAESATMSRLEAQLHPGLPDAAGTPNAATTVMLGPMLRGNQVTLR